MTCEEKVGGSVKSRGESARGQLTKVLTYRRGKSSEESEGEGRSAGGEGRGKEAESRGKGETTESRVRT